MTTQYENMTDTELLIWVTVLARREVIFRIVRKRHAKAIAAIQAGRDISDSEDPGYIFIGKHGVHKDRWTQAKDGNYYRASTVGKAWEEFKKTDEYKNHPEVKE